MAGRRAVADPPGGRAARRRAAADPDSDRAIRRRLLGLTPRAGTTGLLVTAAALLGAAGTVVQAVALARLLGGVFAGNAVDGGAVAWAAAAVAARGIAGWAQATAAQRAASDIKLALRTGLLDAAARRSPYDPDGRRAGETSTLLTRGLDALDPYLVGYLPQMLVAGLVPPAVLVAMLVHDPVSALILLVSLPLVPVFGALVGLHTRDATARQWAALARLGGHFLDALRGLTTLRVLGRAPAQEGIVAEVADAHRRATLRTLRITFLSTLVLDTVATLSIALIAVPVGLRLLGGSLDLTTGLTVLLLAPEAFQPLRALGSRFHAGTEGMATAREALTSLDAPAGVGAPREESSASEGESSVRRDVAKPPEPSVPRPPQNSAPPSGPPRTGADADPARTAASRTVGTASRDARIPSGDAHRTHLPQLRFEHVTVRLPGRPEPVLRDVSFGVEPGEHIALTGPSGAGKSTLLALLLGLVRPESGRILVDGKDLAALDPDAWLRQTAWVPQRPHLFDRSVAGNIRLGDPDARDEQVERAARAAAAHDFIAALPDGYATRLGARGTTVSAGQRRRIALARAFLRDAPLVLLDEPTAGLDAGTEEEVLTASRSLMAGRTVLVVAHRERLVQGADRRLDVRGARVRAWEAVR
ncbi:ABC transporter ATP-binding protein/permease [Streptomyces sp. NPDC050418]|uniref:ABC transporter ATP-binding protein/permease n=1 Tax=Streptomyces sp. NPDC050418 TaxID=3365612 RepID=UPI0037AA9F04